MITFSETIAEHAARLNTSYNFVRIRRRVLAAKWSGQVISKMNDDIPYHVHDAPIAELLQTLKIQPDPNCDLTDENATSCIPVNDLPDTEDLQSAQLKQSLRNFGFLRYGGEGRPRRTLQPPYGYRKTRDGLWLPHSPAAEAIATAFELIINPFYSNDTSSTHPRQISWVPVADTLNKTGYSRKDGNPWRPDDVRTLIRIPTYAGFVAQKDTPIYRADFIPTPIVDAATFIAAAASGRGRKGMEWLPQLEALVLKK